MPSIKSISYDSKCEETMMGESWWVYLIQCDMKNRVWLSISGTKIEKSWQQYSIIQESRAWEKIIHVGCTDNSRSNYNWSTRYDNGPPHIFSGHGWSVILFRNHPEEVSSVRISTKYSEKGARNQGLVMERWREE